MKASPFISGSDEKNFIIRAGICYAIVCTDMTDKEAITAKINRDSPTGTSHPWTLCEDTQEEKNPRPCSDTPGNFHYFFEC